MSSKRKAPEKQKAVPEQWADGEVREWASCPHCGNGEPFFKAISRGEALKTPDTLVLMPQRLQMVYETVLQTKVVEVLVDVCPKCGVIRARAAKKAVVESSLLAQPQRPRPILGDLQKALLGKA